MKYVNCCCCGKNISSGSLFKSFALCDSCGEMIEAGYVPNKVRSRIYVGSREYFITELSWDYRPHESIRLIKF